MMAMDAGGIGAYFMRHLPTQYNLDGRYMGTFDLPILPLSQRSLELIELSPSPQVAYTSPMRRARQTLEELFPNLNYQVDSRLQERALGQWQGRTKDEVRDGWPEAFLSGGSLDPRFTPPEGETLEALSIRIRSFLLDLSNREVWPAVVMTHNGCIRTVRAMLDDIEVDDFFVESEELAQPFFVSLSDLRLAHLHEVD